MVDTISYTTAKLSLVVFYDENDEEIMELQASMSEREAMRVPCIGEKIHIASFEHDYVNDKKALFRHTYEVVDVCSTYLKNKGFKSVGVQYSVTVKKIKG